MKYTFSKSNQQCAINMMNVAYSIATELFVRCHGTPTCPVVFDSVDSVTISIENDSNGDDVVKAVANISTPNGKMILHDQFQLVNVFKPYGEAVSGLIFERMRWFKSQESDFKSTVDHIQAA